MGFWGSFEDQKYHYGDWTFAYTDPTIRIGFWSTLNQPIGDESWGIDNFYLADNYLAGNHEEPVPEPATIALLGIGIAGLAGAEVRRRRKKKGVDKS